MYCENEQRRPIIPVDGKKITDALKIGDQKARSERDGCGWGIMSRGIEEYESAFFHVFPFTIREFLTERSHRNESTSVLDFMGFGTIFYEAIEKDIPFSHGVSVSLTRFEHRSIRRENDDNKVMHLGGNILEESLWEKLDETIRTYNIPRFGLIVWAACGGVHPEFITDSVYVYEEIFARLWSRLSKQNGTLLVEVPPHIIHNHSIEYQKWKQKLLDWQTQHAYIRRGLYQFNDTERVMRLEKTPLNIHLPTLTDYILRYPQPGAG